MICGARTVFWPGVEDLEAICTKPPHPLEENHEDDVLGEWSE